MTGRRDQTPLNPSSADFREGEPRLEARDRPPGATTSKLDCLDGLRGLAILLVVLYHTHTGQPTPYRPAVAAALGVFRHGHSGVGLFLVLSGFCLAHSALRRRGTGRVQGYRAYLAARWRRIAPPYYAAMALYLAFPIAYLIVGRDSPLIDLLGVRQILSHLLFAHGFWSDTIYAINTPFWSLSLEFQFYLLLPALVWCAGRYGVAAMVAGTFVSSVAWRWFLATRPPDHGYLVNGVFLGRWTEFALGVASAFWFHATANERPKSATTVRLAVLAALGLAVGAGLSELPASRAPAADFAFGVGYAALLAATLHSGRRSGRLERAFAWPPLVWVGTISYSLYLTHSLFIERIVQIYHRLIRPTTAVTDLIAVTVVFTAVIVGGRIFYFLVERHFVRSVDAARPAGEDRAKPTSEGTRDEIDVEAVPSTGESVRL